MNAAASAGIVVPAFNVFYSPVVEAICRALVEYDVFGMVEVSRIEICKFQAGSPTAIAREYRKFADPRVTSLHLDHIPVIDEDGIEVDWEPLIVEGLEAGYDSVMIDASRLPFDENVEITARVVDMAHAQGALVEAELGSVLGHEAGPLPPYEELFASKVGFTDPDQAAEFVRRTGVDWLSVSVGSIHGAITPGDRDRAKIEARLDIERLRELRDATGVPLVLHGGSGVRQSCVLEAVANGIAKINIATDLRQPYERVLAETGSVARAQDAVADVIGRLAREVYGIEGSATRLAGIVDG